MAESIEFYNKSIISYDNKKRILNSYEEVNLTAFISIIYKGITENWSIWMVLKKMPYFSNTLKHRGRFYRIITTFYILNANIRV